MKLSIIIVPYKAKEKVEVTLDAVYASVVNFDYEVIVVDNLPSSGTEDLIRAKYLSKPELVAKTIYVPNSENVGFPKANNQGLKLSTGLYKLLLNPDTKVSPDTLQAMIDFMDSRPDVGISTCKMVKGDGTLDLACRRSFPDPWVSFFRLSGLSKLFPKNKKLAAYNLTYKSIDEETETDSGSGAFLFVSPACYEKIGLLDEGFYMYGEDLDWCFRAKEAGFKVWYYPKTTTIHYKGQSSRQNPYALYAFHDAMWIFYKKHLYHKYPKPFSWLVYVGIWGRYYLKRFINFFKAEKIVSK
jgi:GT2 family glycosyltransferase